MDLFSLLNVRLGLLRPRSPTWRCQARRRCGPCTERPGVPPAAAALTKTRYFSRVELKAQTLPRRSPELHPILCKLPLLTFSSCLLSKCTVWSFVPPPAWWFLANTPKFRGGWGRSGNRDGRRGRNFCSSSGCLGSCRPFPCNSLPFSRRKKPGEAFSPGEKKYSN